MNTICKGTKKKSSNSWSTVKEKNNLKTGLKSQILLWKNSTETYYRGTRIYQLFVLQVYRD